MDRTLWLKHWDEAATSGLWAGAWPKMLAGITAEQAATRPHGRNSIWQIVNHIIVWREEALHRATGGQSSPDADLQQHNFEAPAKVDETSWRAALDRLGKSHERVRDHVANAAIDFARVQYVLAHDCYHFGQIAYIRGLLSLPPIE